MPLTIRTTKTLFGYPQQLLIHFKRCCQDRHPSAQLFTKSLHRNHGLSKRQNSIEWVILRTETVSVLLYDVHAVQDQRCSFPVYDVTNGVPSEKWRFIAKLTKDIDLVAPTCSLSNQSGYPLQYYSSKHLDP